MYIPSVPVDIWRISLTQPRELHLSDSEMERARRFRFENDRTRWSRSHSALRIVLSRYTGIPPLAQRFVLGEHGKPALDHPAAPHFNLSHSGDWGLIAVSTQAPVGVDVERIREGVDIQSLLQRIGEFDLPAVREACFQRWANREARSKACGGPLMVMPSGKAYSAEVEMDSGYAAAVALINYFPIARYHYLNEILTHQIRTKP